MVLTKKMIFAAGRGDNDAIHAWFASGTRDPDEKDLMGRSLLDWAAAGGQCDMMRTLLDHGASVDATCVSIMTPLHGAAGGGHCAAVVLLLDRGAQIDPRPIARRTPLIYSAEYGQCDVIRLLLQHGASLDARTRDGRDAEASARLYDKREAAALLADVRLAGGWEPYLRAPRKRLLALRILCEQGRARTDDPFLRRLFPLHATPRLPPNWASPKTRASFRARTASGAEVPREVFWLVLAYWRTGRDSPY